MRLYSFFKAVAVGLVAVEATKRGNTLYSPAKSTEAAPPTLCSNFWVCNDFSKNSNISSETFTVVWGSQKNPRVMLAPDECQEIAANEICALQDPPAPQNALTCWVNLFLNGNLTGATAGYIFSWFNGTTSSGDPPGGLSCLKDVGPNFYNVTPGGCASLKTWPLSRDEQLASDSEDESDEEPERNYSPSRPNF